MNYSLRQSEQAGGFVVVSKNVNALETAPFPTDYKQIRKFFGAYNVNKRIIEDFFEILGQLKILFRRKINQMVEPYDWKWLIPKSLDMQLALFSFNSKTTEIWMSGLW